MSEVVEKNEENKILIRTISTPLPEENRILNRSPRSPKTSEQNQTPIFHEPDEMESMWIVDFDKLLIGKLIGEGSFGKVYKADYLGTTVALKQIVAQTSDIKEEFENEVRILRSLRHPNVLMFMGMCCNKDIDALFIITEFMNAGSLEDLLLKHHAVDISWRQRLTVAYEVAKSLQYIHSRNFIHRDLKAGNILVDDDWTVKISDFGLCKYKKHPRRPRRGRVVIKDESGEKIGDEVVEGEMINVIEEEVINGIEEEVINGVEEEGKGEQDHEPVGTIWYRAPEIERCESYDERADIFSYGLVLAEIFSRTQGEDIRAQITTMKKDKTRREFYFLIESSLLKNIAPPDCPPGFLELAIQCCSERQEDRPSMSNILEKLHRIYTELTSIEESTAYILKHHDSIDIWLSSLNQVAMESSGHSRGRSLSTPTSLEVNQDHKLNESNTSMTGKAIPIPIIVDQISSYLQRKTTRTLSEQNLIFLSVCLGKYKSLTNTEGLTINRFSQFWDQFFHPILQLLWNPKVFPLYKAGLLEGFITKEQAYTSLTQYGKSGALLIRFSQSSVGSLVFNVYRNSQVYDSLIKVEERGFLLMNTGTFYHSIKRLLSSSPLFASVCIFFPSLVEIASPVCQKALDLCLVTAKSGRRLRHQKTESF